MLDTIDGFLRVRVGTAALTFTRRESRHAVKLRGKGWSLSDQARDWWKSPHTGAVHCGEHAAMIEAERDGHQPEKFEPMFHDRYAGRPLMAQTKRERRRK